MGSLYVGLDVADKMTSICVLDTSGQALLETSVETDGAAIVAALKPYRRMLAKVGHETGCKATWLHKELQRKKLPVVCLDAYRTHSALAASRNKTDTNDARGIAEVLCRGIYTEAFVRSDASQRARDLLNHRTALVRKRADLELLLGATLKLSGARLVSDRSDKTAKIMIGSHRAPADLADTLSCTMRAIAMLREEAMKLEKVLERQVNADPVCRRLMTTPGVGPITAFAFRSALDDPKRFSSSRAVAVYFGLTPRTYQSGSFSTTGHISKRGDASVRSLLYQAGSSMLIKVRKPSRLRTWAVRLREQKGFKIAATACARRMAVIMHKMWITERDFDPER
jgi:transposase